MLFGLSSRSIRSTGKIRMPRDAKEADSADDTSSTRTPPISGVNSSDELACRMNDEDLSSDDLRSNSQGGDCPKKSKRKAKQSVLKSSKEKSNRSLDSFIKKKKEEVYSTQDNDEASSSAGLYDLPSEIIPSTTTTYAHSKRKAVTETKHRTCHRQTSEVLLSPAPSRRLKTKSLRVASKSSKSLSLEKHLEQQGQRPPGTTIATDPTDTTDPLSPCESVFSRQQQEFSSPRRRSKSLSRFLVRTSDRNLVDNPSPAEAPPSPPKSPGWRIRESFKHKGMDSVDSLSSLGGAGDLSSTPKSYRRKSLRNTDQSSQLPDALRLAAAAGIGGKKTKSLRRLRVDTKLAKEESKLRQRSNSFDKELWEPEIADKLEQDILVEKQVETKAISPTISPRRPRPNSVDEEILATPSKACIDRNTRKKCLEGASPLKSMDDKLEMGYENDLVRRQSDCDRYAPHNRPGVAHHKSENAHLDGYTPLASVSNSIVDKVPKVVSLHTSKLKPPPTDEELSLASINSSLTPSVATRDLDDDEEEDEEEVENNAVAPNQTAGHKETVNEVDRFGKSPPPRAKSTPVSKDASFGLTPRQLARLSDSSPTIPKRLNSIQVDLGEEGKLDLPKTTAIKPAGMEQSLTHRYSSDHPVDDSPSDEERSIQLKDVTSSPGPPKRWSVKSHADLPPAFQVVASYSKRSFVSRESIEEGDTEEASFVSTPDSSNSSTAIATRTGSLKGMMPAPKRKASKVKTGEERANQANAAEVLKLKIAQMNESLRIKSTSGHTCLSKEIVDSEQDIFNFVIAEAKDDLCQHRHSLSAQADSLQSSFSVPRHGGQDTACIIATRKLKKKDSKRDLIQKEGSKRSVAKPTEDDATSSVSSSSSYKRVQGHDDVDTLVIQTEHVQKAKSKKLHSSDKSVSSLKSSKSTNEIFQIGVPSSLKKRSKSLRPIRKDQGNSHRRDSHSSSRSKSPKSKLDRTTASDKKVRSRSQSPSGCRGKRQPKSLLHPETLAPWQIKQQFKPRVSPMVSVYTRRIDDDDDGEDDPSVPPAFQHSKSKRGKKMKKQSKEASQVSDDESSLKSAEKLQIERRRVSVLKALGRYSQDKSSLPPAFRHLGTKLKMDT